MNVLIIAKFRMRMQGTSGGYLAQPGDVKAGPVRAGCSGLVHLSLEHLQGWKVHHLSEQPVLVVHQFHREEFFPYMYHNFSRFLLHLACAPLRAWRHLIYTFPLGSFSLLATLLLIQPGVLWATFAARTCCWSMLFTQIPGSFSAELLFILSASSLSCWDGVTLQVQDAAFALGIHEVPVSLFLESWVPSELWPSIISLIWYHCRLVESAFCPIIQVIKALSNIGPSIHPSGCQLGFVCPSTTLWAWQSSQFSIQSI